MSITSSPIHSAQLRRTIGPTQMAFYALGSMLGSGIYGLIGQAAGLSGSAVWLSFLVALVAALLTAISYASLGSRYPRAGGAAYIVERAFRSPLLGFVAGLGVVCSGLASVATQSQVFARNLAELLDVTQLVAPAIAFGFLLVLAGVVFRGIRESMWINIVCTCLSRPAAQVCRFFDATAAALIDWRDVERPLLIWIVVTADKRQHAISASQEACEHRSAHHQCFELSPTVLRVVAERCTREHLIAGNLSRHDRDDIKETFPHRRVRRKRVRP